MLTGKIMKIMLAVCMFGSTAWAADQQEVTLHGVQAVGRDRFQLGEGVGHRRLPYAS